MPSGTTSNSLNDPLTLALKPPPDETPTQRAARLENEKEAQRISDEIDVQLKHDKVAAEKRLSKRLVRVLLLGQSESGKSTVLKNFQRSWAPKSWRAERLSWRSVVYFNIVNSALKILSVLFMPPEDPSESDPTPTLSQEIDALYADLLSVQKTLKRRFGSMSEVPDDNRTGVISPMDPSEFFVRSDTSWKDRLLGKFAGRRPSMDTRLSMETETHATDVVRDALLRRRSDIQALWHDPGTRALLGKVGLRLEDTPGFFMDDLDRILVRDYEPSDEDMVRARLRTMGIQEHTFIFESGIESGREWRMYDVGGSRPQRGMLLAPRPLNLLMIIPASWFSFFEDVNAVLFVVAVNCFDEVLDEDRNVNRLQDSLDLWKVICRSPLLAKAQLMLFLNKVDLLERKLKEGISFARYVPTYEDRENNRESVCRYLRNLFKNIQKRYSPTERPFHVWVTCATDTRATEKTLLTVRHGILTRNFERAELI